ncbi:metallophosphoesterase [Colwellia sp. PAMC 21821]|uniref:metallophosphoesterase n=1 Tax=Colwellia sp. PAMC 21821 TaxID=1816219 RepID=UPI0009BFA077|nr:metallophosphoesterase [Colwellia sp. PAMC 21821]ARD44034.1 hypothetical protein A3Q33_06730 [Colwellia sp. PAMC 21821]
MPKKIKYYIIILPLVLIACLYFLGQIEFRDNKYGLSEIRLFDLSFGLTKTFDDGPYIFIEQNELVEKSIVAGKVIVRSLPKGTFPVSYADEKNIFTNIPEIAAISDIHGQYGILINILKKNNIIDDNLNWSFGDGHFVIAGDIFDRGAEVLDVLWFIYNLEKQAEDSGGKVHYLLGNHEYMVLHGNLKWLNGIYHHTAKLLEVEYQSLFNEHTILGAWLRAKSTIIKINDVVYVHGGISKEFLSHNYDLETINDMYRKSIDLTAQEIENSREYSLLHSKLSPIWYRGYFKTFLLDAISSKDVNEVLTLLKVNKIVVGHTSGKEVTRLTNGEVYAIDSSIKKGITGDILFINESGVYRGSYTGERTKL